MWTHLLPWFVFCIFFVLVISLECLQESLLAFGGRLICGKCGSATDDTTARRGCHALKINQTVLDKIVSKRTSGYLQNFNFVYNFQKMQKQRKLSQSNATNVHKLLHPYIVTHATQTFAASAAPFLTQPAYKTSTKESGFRITFSLKVYRCLYNKLHEVQECAKITLLTL